MYIQKISIKNYRCYRDFSMEFQKGLNVIIGTNNSGKTGLLYAIRLKTNDVFILSIVLGNYMSNKIFNFNTWSILKI